MTRLLAALLATLASGPSLAPAAAAPSDPLPLQMRLAAADGTPVEGPVAFQVRLYDVEVGGTPLWSEDHAATALGGVVTVLLGTATPFPPDLFDGSPLWLTLEVEGDGEMLPRRRVGAVPYARRAETVDLADGAVGTGALADQAVTSAKLAAGAVDALAIASDAVGASELASDAVGAGHIAPGAVGASDLAPNAVGAEHIQSDAVGASELAPGAVGSVEIQDGAITASDLAPGAVGSIQIATGAVLSSDIFDGAITSADLAAGAVTSDELADDAVTSAKLAPSSVTNAAIADGSVGPYELLAQAVGSLQLADGSIADVDVAFDADIAGSKIDPTFFDPVTTTQRLGVGTSAPSERIHVVDDGGATLRIEADADDSGETDHPVIELSQDGGLHVARIGFFYGSDDFEIVHGSAKALHLGTAGERRLTIDGANGRVGVNMPAPARTVHVVGDATVASVLVAPDEAGSGDDAELFLAEDDDGTYGMRIRYDGGANDLEVYGEANGTSYGPHLAIDRSSGLTTIPGELRAGPGGAGTPLAHASVSQAGLVLGGSSNLSVKSYDVFSQTYLLQLDGVSDFDVSRYVVVPVALDPVPAVPTVVDEGSSTFSVRWWELGGLPAPRTFSVVVYRL